jgi:alpha-glucosidase
MLLLCPAVLGAQTLAQKNWAGSGVTIESWWRRAVLYRIDPARFQDSTGAGVGDLAGITQRLGYIQSLGADAIVLAPAADAASLQPNATGLDGLIRGAADHHLRLIVALPTPASQSAADDARFLGLARAWFNQGAAGLYLPTAALTRVDGSEHIAALLRQLHALANSMPGDHILLAASPPEKADDVLLHALAQNVQLVERTPLPALNDAATLRAALAPSSSTDEDTIGTETKPARRLARRSATQSAPASLLVAARVPGQPSAAQQATLERTLAAMLLTTGGAVVIDYGEELGLLPSPNTPLLMQWTPANRTEKPSPEKDTAAASEGPPPPSDAFRPYVPPLPRNFFTPPPMPEVIAVDHPINPLLDPNAMPGFTSGDAPIVNAPNGATANALLEDADADSLLNFYRRLIQLRHSDLALRRGTVTALDEDGAVLWLRSSAPGANDAALVVVANLATQPLSLSSDRLRLHGRSLRTVLGPMPTRSASSLTFAPQSVFLGEAGR